MKSPSLKSLVSMLLFGALGIGQLAGCGELGETADDDLSSTASALSRTTAVDAVAPAPAATPKRTATLDPAVAKGSVAGTVTAALTPAPPPAGTDFDGNHPWSVYLTGTGGLSCRGTLIHPQWVLTAGHCMGPYAGSVAYDRTDPVTGVKASDSRRFDEAGANRGIFRHPNYVADSGFGQPKNDIMLVRLAQPFAIDRNIQTAALPRFFANPGRTGTIATNNHSNAPAGYVSIVRTTQQSTCTAPNGFICISPPAGSLCKGDSGSGFVELLNGRAQLVGVTSNIDSSDGGDCVAANKQAELADVYAYRDWIYSTIGLNPEQADGRVRLRWSGAASQPGIMSLQCLSATRPAVEVSMDVPGSEISMDGCDDVRVFCQPQGSYLAMSSFTMRTIASNGALLSTTALAIFPAFAIAAGDPGSSFLGFTCGVSDQRYPIAVANVNGSVAAAF